MCCSHFECVAVILSHSCGCYFEGVAVTLSVLQSFWKCVAVLWHFDLSVLQVLRCCSPFECAAVIWEVCGFHVFRVECVADFEVLWCVAVCCSVLQQEVSDAAFCGAECCRVLQSVAECCSVLQCVAIGCSMLQCVAVCHNVS